MKFGRKMLEGYLLIILVILAIIAFTVLGVLGKATGQEAGIALTNILLTLVIGVGLLQSVLLLRFLEKVKVSEVKE